jgi:G3E family GTPase
VLEVRATVCLMDPRHLASPRHREHPNFVDQIHLADVLVANKADLCTARDVAAFEAFAAQLAPRKQRVGMVEHGRLDPAWLDIDRGAGRRAAFPEAHAFLVDHPADGEEHPAEGAGEWQLIEGAGDGYRRAGWLIRQRDAWPLTSLQALLDGLGVERKKGLFLTTEGWYGCNQALWVPVEEPADGRARLELIDPDPIAADSVDRALRAIGVPETEPNG